MKTPQRIIETTHSFWGRLWTQSLLLFAATMLSSSVRAQVEVLSPDYNLFGKTSGDYTAEWSYYFAGQSSNWDCAFPDASPLSDERVYFLQRPLFFDQVSCFQTYFVPDDVYVFLPIISRAWDNVEVMPPYTLEQLRDLLRADVDSITNVLATIDGVPVASPLAYRTESAFFSMYFRTSDNIYTLLLQRPFDGLVDPIIAGGYFLMLKPLPAGLHDVQTAYAFGPPINVERERRYQIHSLSVLQWLAHQTERLAANLNSSSLPANRQKGLVATLNAAKASFDSENFRAALGQLGAFQNIVRAQISHDNPTLADQLSTAAQRIIDKAATQLR
jgi:hypothetical protein